MNTKSALGDTVMEMKFQYSNVMEMNDDGDGDDDDDNNDQSFLSTSDVFRKPLFS